jgi:hypothetical protein
MKELDDAGNAATTCVDLGVRAFRFQFPLHPGTAPDWRHSRESWQINVKILTPDIRFSQVTTVTGAWRAPGTPPPVVASVLLQARSRAPRREFVYWLA